jgi:hypothetical protein
MSNAKRRHRRRWRRAHDRTYALWKAKMEKLGLWGFDRCATWTTENGNRVHVLRGGFGYF